MLQINDEFTFTVVVNGIDGTYSTNKADVTVTNGEETTFTLKHGETFEIKNLPAGAVYTVKETDSKGYDTTNVSVNGGKAVESKSANGTINLDATNTVAYTNIDTVTPPTGVDPSFCTSPSCICSSVLWMSRIFPS